MGLGLDVSVGNTGVGEAARVVGLGSVVGVGGSTVGGTGDGKGVQVAVLPAGGVAGGEQLAQRNVMKRKRRERRFIVLIKRMVE